MFTFLWWPASDRFHRNILAKLCRGDFKNTLERATDDRAVSNAVVLDSDNDADFRGVKLDRLPFSSNSTNSSSSAMDTVDIRGFKFIGKRKGWLRGDRGDAGELEVLESGLSPSAKEKPPKAADAVVEFIGSCVKSVPGITGVIEEARRIPRRRGDGGLSSSPTPFAIWYSATIKGLEHLVWSGWTGFTSDWLLARGPELLDFSASLSKRFCCSDMESTDNLWRKRFMARTRISVSSSSGIHSASSSKALLAKDPKLYSSEEPQNPNKSTIRIPTWNWKKQSNPIPVASPHTHIHVAFHALCHFVTLSFKHVKNGDSFHWTKIHKTLQLTLLLVTLAC